MILKNKFKNFGGKNMHKIKESLTKQLLIIVAVIVAISQIGIISVIADVSEPNNNVLITSEKTNAGIDCVYARSLYISAIVSYYQYIHL